MEDKLVPHSIDAEEAVLGSIIVDADCFSEVKTIINARAFYRETNRWVFEAMESLIDKGSKVDQLTLSQELTDKGQLEQIGGLAYLSHLVNATPTSVHAQYYARIVAKEFYRREMITTGAKIASIAYAGNGDSMELFLRAQEALKKLEPDDKEEIINPKQHAEDMLTMLSLRKEKHFDRALFGYRDLDDFTGGMYGGDFVIVGARPGVGKSQSLLEITLYNAKYLGKTVLFASAEMSLAQIAEREIVMESGIDMRRLRSGSLTDQDWDIAQEVVEKVAGMPLYFIKGKLSVASISQKAKLLKQTKGLNLVVVDYIQLLRDRSDKKVGDNLRERIGYISNGLKNLAKDLDIPVLAACQLNREVEGRPGHRPMLSDLRESGELEQDADMVLLLHRPELYDTSKDKGIMEIGIAKIRQLGTQGVVRLIWVEKEHRYRDIFHHADLDRG